MSEAVLIVDDEALIAHDLADTVRESGRRVIGPAVSIPEARTLLENATPDLALLDVNIRGETVWEFALELRNRGCALVFCTASLRPEASEFDLEGCEFLEKPASSALILKALERQAAS